MNSIPMQRSLIPVMEFPSYVRSFFHPGISNCSLKKREDFEKVNAIALREIDELMGPGGEYEGQPIEVVGPIVYKKFKPTFSSNDEGAYRCEPFAMDEITYNEACDYVEKNWIKQPISLMSSETFHLMLKMIHIRILDPLHPNLKGILTGEYRTWGHMFVNKNPAHLDIPLITILKQEKEKIKGTPQEQVLDKQIKNASELHELSLKDPDLTFYDISMQRRGVTAEQAALYNQYYVAFPAGKDVPGLMEKLYLKIQKDLKDKRNVISIASEAHQELVRIHPFSEGNGRMARMLMNIILMQGGHQPIAFATDKAYTDAIRADDAGVVGAFEKYIRKLVGQFDYEALPIDLLETISKIEKNLDKILKCLKKG